jgi:hypothetical protein
MTEELDIKSFVSKHLGDFKPIAYFDKHLDCIRVKISDCRCVEVRLNRFLTMLEKRESNETRVPVGFTIKGIAHLFDTLGLPREGVYKVVDILNRLLEKYPDEAVKRVWEQFSQSQISNIEVDVRRAA